jgi:hypothetical protein
VSEVRGRNRPGWVPETVPAAQNGAAPDWGLDWLPLQNDLTEGQLREEAQVLLGVLASDLKVNDADNPAGSYSSRLETQANALAAAQGDQAINTEWGKLAKLIQDFDFQVQETLVTESETVICGYQLGRALADSYWALKNEMYYQHHFPGRTRARFAVAEYIEVFYNRIRLHSSLGYRTPLEALTDHQTAAAAA